MFFLFSWCSTGGLGAHSAGCWLPLLHLISNFTGPQLIRAPSPFGLVWLSLPHLASNWLPLVNRTQLSYRIVRRPLDLWNRMFNRHQAEITVMQFRGHSLPVHHSVVAQWDLHLVPYYQPWSTWSLSITGHWNVSLASGASPWLAFLGRVEGQNTTIEHEQKFKTLMRNLTGSTDKKSTTTSKKVKEHSWICG